jgi:uracil-DNA glycosylase
LKPAAEEQTPMANDYTEGRGDPWDYDPGPPRNRRWPRLFSETPNYRGLSKAVLGSEKFRWHFGPLFYRGRLGDDDVKVLIIGQEGGQDEALSHRAFTGSSGSRMQHFLGHLGITESYLFLNTFVYSIHQQYSGSKIRWLAQHPASPIVRHRHEILDYAADRNDLHLVVAVGTAARETVRTWIESRGGTCPDGEDDLTTAESTVLGPHARAIGVVHPGGAASGNITAIKKSFVRAIEHVADWADDDASWLPVDPGDRRGTVEDWTYGKAPIPFRDLAFGTPWRLGHGSTTSNRKDSQRGIQIFSADGRYRNDGHRLTYDGDAAGSDTGYEAAPADLPYEPPVADYTAFDRGPGSTWARLLVGGRSGLPWPDFADLGATGHPSFGPGPVYRGRPDDASVIILADQCSHDDLFNGRALTGEAGQRLTGLLEAMGITESYVIFRVLPVDTLDDPLSVRNACVDHPATRALYAALVGRVSSANAKDKILLAVGTMARRLVDHVNPQGLPVVEMKSWRQSGASSSWRSALDDIAGLDYDRDDDDPSFDWDGRRRQIPRIDLPYGPVCWQGSSGDRALKPRRGSKPSPDYFKLMMPRWAFELDPRPLDDEETAALENAP